MERIVSVPRNMALTVYYDFFMLADRLHRR